MVWIDLDDTLWDFKANSRVALRGLYDDYQLSRWFESPAQWIECYERHNHALWNHYNHALISKEYLMKNRFLLPLAEAGSPLAKEFGARFDREYLDRLAQCTLLVDGAIELLKWIKERGEATGILSNGFTEVQYRKINNSGLAPYIDHIVLSDEIGINKPDVRIFRHAEKVAGERPEHCIMIGDNPDTDLRGAIDAGWHPIYFDRDNKPTINIPTARRLTNIPQIIEKILNNQ